MNKVYGFVPRDLLASGGRCVGNRGGEVYKFFIPDVKYINGDIGAPKGAVSDWSVVEIPADEVEFDSNKFPAVDGKPVDYAALSESAGDVVLVSEYASGSFSGTEPGGTRTFFTSQDAFARFNCYMESAFIEKSGDTPGMRRMDLYQSCVGEYSDEQPYFRPVRMSRMGVAPSQAPDMYRDVRTASDVYADLPNRSGFVDVSHALVPKDLISDDVVLIEDVPYRKVSVPSNGNLGMYNINDRSQYDTVCIRSEYFRDAAMLKGQPLGPDSGKYAVCSLPYDAEICETDGAIAHYVRPWEICAKLTCATSGQVLGENAPFGRSDYNELFNRVANASATGPAWNLFEIKTGIPSTSIVIDYGNDACHIKDPDTGKTDSDAVFDMMSRFDGDARDKFMAGLKDGIASFNQAASNWYSYGIYMDEAMSKAFGVDAGSYDPFRFEESKQVQAPVNEPVVEARQVDPFDLSAQPPSGTPVLDGGGLNAANPFDIDAAPSPDTRPRSGRDMADIDRAVEGIDRSGSAVDEMSL